MERGWVLDGFPVTVTQGRLLEQALTGFDPQKEAEKLVNSQSTPATDPRAPLPPPTPNPALDLVVHLNISDREALSRYSKHNPRKSRDVLIYRQEFFTFGESSRKRSAVRKPNTEEELLHNRLTTFNLHWPKIEEWYRTQQILVKIDGEINEETLKRKVEEAFAEALYNKQHKELEKDIVVVGKVQAEQPPPAPCPEPVPKSARDRDKTPSKAVVPVAAEAPKEKKGKKEEKRPSKPSAGSGKGRKGRVDIVPEPVVETAPPVTPPTQPGSEQWIYVEETLPEAVVNYLLLYWDTLVETISETVKTVMRDQRLERHRIITYLHTIRKEFQDYLLSRPDHKQEFVSLWQLQYNQVSPDIRNDEETRAELHQRFNDLQERLWDISDKRKEDAEQERNRILNNGWLEAHLGILINHFTTLMQMELDGFQDCQRFLRDYYKAMEGTILPEDPMDFTRLPLVNPTEPSDTHSARESLEMNKVPDVPLRRPISKQKSDERSEAEGRVEDKEPKTTKIPLVPHRIPSSSLGVEKEKEKVRGRGGARGKESSPETASLPLTNVDEFLILEAHQMAVTSITAIISKEMRLKEAEEQRDKKLKEDKEKERQRPSTGRTSKLKAKPSSKKKGEHVMSPPPVPTEEESPEEITQRKLKERMYQEYFRALEVEEFSAGRRLELIKLKALAVVQNIKSNIEDSMRNMEESLGERFLAEMASIKEFTQYVRQRIEDAEQIQPQLIVRNTEFLINSNVLMFEDEEEITRPPAREQTKDGELSIEQLKLLLSQLQNTAPTGFILRKTFIDLLQDLVLLNLGTNCITDQWSSLTYSQILEMTSLLTPDSELVAWRRFLLSAAQPWPLPSVTDLLNTKAQCQALDTTHTGLLTREQYSKVKLWFTEELDVKIPEDPAEPLAFDRLGKLKELLFDVFVQPGTQPPQILYSNMLLHFSAHPDPLEGVHRAIAVTTGAPLSWALPGIAEQGLLEEEEVDEGGEEEVLIPIEALLEVATHTCSQLGDTHRFNSLEQLLLSYSEMFVQIYCDLGHDTLEPLPLSVLLLHPSFESLLSTNKQLLLPDFTPILRKADEGESTAPNSP